MDRFDELAIQALYSRHFYSLDGLSAVTGGRADVNWAATFTPDGKFAIARSGGERLFEAFGTEQLISAFATFPDVATTRHWMNNLVIEPDGAGAHGGCYIIAMNVGVSPAAIIRTGIYDDRLVKVASDWKFQSRTLVLDPHSPAG